MKFNELCEARIALEPYAAARAMPYLNDAKIAELKALNTLGDQAMAQGNFEEISSLNQDFHRLLYSANPHQVTQPLIESLWLQLGPFMRLATSSLEEYYVVDRHDEAMQAIEKHDAIALQLAIKADIREGIAFVSTPEALHNFIEQSNTSAR